MLIVACSRIEAACIDPSTFVQSTMSIARHFNEEERKALPGVVGIRGTAWFLSSRLLVTAAHVAEAMHLSADEWKDVEMRNGEGKRSLSVRVLHLAGRNAEKIAVLELRSEIPNAAVLQRRAEPLIADEQVVGIAYPDNQLRFAGGRFVQEGDNDKFAGSALFEMYDGNDRLVLDHGASGAPVLDCDGRVVAVVTTLITRTMNFLSNVIRISTAWQSPNVVAIPIQVLKDFSPLERH
jgi:Trypsin-like peptidase domain